MSISPTFTPFSGTQSGTYLSAGGKPEAFSRTISNQDGVRTASTSFTRADGKTITRSDTFTKTATGYTNSSLTTLANGRTTSSQVTGTRQADGTVAISGTYVDQTGQTDQVSGTGTFAKGSSSADLTLTNAAGQTSTRDSQTVDGQKLALTTVQGTNFGGTAFSSTAAFAILKSQESAPASLS